MLAGAAGNVVTKDELLARVWPGLVVEENNLQVQVSALRKALDEDQSGQSYLITVPGRGYRFIGLVESSNEPALPDKPSIAVLPFQNMSDDPQQEYFADGMAEDIITALCPHALAVRDRARFELRLQGADGGCEAGGSRAGRALRR